MTAAPLGPIVLVTLACGLDRLLGDPRRCLSFYEERILIAPNPSQSFLLQFALGLEPLLCS